MQNIASYIIYEFEISLAIATYMRFHAIAIAIAIYYIYYKQLAIHNRKIKVV